MNGATRALRVNTIELRRQPGLRRPIEVDLGGADLDVEDQRLTEPIEVRLNVESTIDGLVVHGAVRVRWLDECRRCLVSLRRDEPMDVDELYQDEVVDESAFELGPDALDLTATVRDAVVLALADPPVACRADCAGICPVCGADRNETTCACDTSVRDDRWAALDQLDLDPASGDST